MEFQKGDVSFIMHNGALLSKTLAWFMGSKWSHSNIVTKPTDEYTFVSETSDFTVTVGWLERYTQDPDVTMETYRIKDLDPNLAAEMAATCMDNYNILYGYLQFISWGIICLLAKVGITCIPNFIRQGLVCDQNVLTGLTLSSVPGLQGIDPMSIHTERMYQIISNSDSFTLVYKK